MFVLGAWPAEHFQRSPPAGIVERDLTRCRRMTTPDPAHRNRLAAETSPYLLQHAANPVEWYPWGDDALGRARREDKPILLSVGYSACHWCHVMAHESFEDPATAALMNALFVNVKVDREERPDLDRIYQIAHQLLTQRGGGWPLTMFLSPEDQRPFFGGTYFPREPRHGMPAFRDLLQRVADYYRTHRDEIRRQNAALVQVLAEISSSPVAAAARLDAAPLSAARDTLEQDFDARFGGFGGAPKFPHPTSIEFLLQAWRATAGATEPDLKALYMATLTLTRMAEGGLYDQLGGGFCRYSVDMFWMIPHFEKMLYDNGQLLGLYADAAVATGEELFRHVVGETADWVMRDMQAADGGYYATLDADSEGHEGRFYAWTREEVDSLLDADTYAVFARRFGLDRDPNFEGRWHLHAYRAIEDVAAELGIAAELAGQRLGVARCKLLGVRNQRIWPARDEKIIAAWNGLMIAGMARAATVLERPELADSALRAVDFVRSQMLIDGRLMSVAKDGRARFPAYLDDHAFLLAGLIELLGTRFRVSDLEFALRLADTLLERFEDPDGGFYFTANDHEALIQRPKSFGDEAVPAGNGMAARALLRLGYLVGNPRYVDAAERTLRSAWSAIEKYPSGHTSLLLALREALEAPTIVILRGGRDEVARWQTELSRVYVPTRLVLAIADDVDGLPPALAEKRPRDTTVAYVCRGTTCSAPVESLSGLIAMTRA
jgi:uncharacterized protein YyaL (SSP411 family)